MHADDVGMCHGANTAFVELSKHGSITAGSVMVPCPWFPEIGVLAASDSSLNVGVHLVLTHNLDFRKASPPRSGP